MAKKSDMNELTWEEEGVYTIKAIKDKNRFELIFHKAPQKAKEVPNISEHIRQAMEELEDGVDVVADALKFTRYPGFGITKPFSEAQKHLMAKKPRKVSTLSAMITVKVAVNVLGKLTGLNSRFFKTREESEKWMEED